MGCASSAQAKSAGSTGSPPSPGHEDGRGQNETLLSAGVAVHEVASVRVEITGGVQASRVAKRPDILEALEGRIVRCISECGNLHERSVEDLDGADGHLSVFFTNATKKRIAVGAVVKLTKDVQYKQYSMSAGLTGTVIDLDTHGDARVDFGSSGAQWLLKQDVSAVEVVAEQAVIVGVLVVLKREVRYKQYTLQEGLRGLVLEVDSHGDARVNWELFGEQWLLGRDFDSASVQAASTSPPKLAITACGVIRLCQAHILGIGATLVVATPVVYVDYTLPQGLNGYVAQLDAEGDALVEWEEHGHQWLMRKDFCRVEVQHASRDHRDWGYGATMESLRLCLDTDQTRDFIADTYREAMEAVLLPETLPLGVEVFLEAGPPMQDDNAPEEFMEPAQVLEMMRGYEDLQDPGEPDPGDPPWKEKRPAAPPSATPPPAPAFPFCSTSCAAAVGLPVKTYQVPPDDSKDEVGHEGKSGASSAGDFGTVPAVGVRVRAALDVMYDHLCVPAGSQGVIVSLQPSIGVSWFEHPELENAEVFLHQIRIVGAPVQREISVDEAPYGTGAEPADVVGGVPVWSPARPSPGTHVVCGIIPGCCAPEVAEGKKMEIVRGAPVHYGQPR